MKYFFSLLFFFLASCGHTYYIVRHAEKAAPGPNMTSDVPLSSEGEQRALELKDVLKNKRIVYIFSTNTIRTRSTAQPTADYFGLKTEIYGPKPDSVFIALLKARTKNTLIVGHSNTVDDVVNMLCKRKEVNGDLPETEYDNLFTVRKRGSRYIFRALTYGRPTQ
jgi:phosphohistidine phosphatase SixA